jgi:TRAP-type mannitol/chloroaromatic compound transport system permease small subunit
MATTEHVTRAEGSALLRFNLKLSRAIDLGGQWGSYFIMPLVAITIFDVFIRKLIWIQLWLIETFGKSFASTTLQELEWHFHTVIFCLVLGYGYVNNRHVRVDLIRETLSFRRQAWIEFLGVTVFMIPFTGFVLFFSTKFAWDSYMTNEISGSMVGLGYRWIIKTVFVLGLLMAILAGLAVWLETVLILFGSEATRFRLMTLAWPGEEVDRRIDADAEETVEAVAKGDAQATVSE